MAVQEKKKLTDAEIKKAFKSHNENLNLPVEPDKLGLTADKAKMIELLAKTGHTNEEICKELPIPRETLQRWMKKAEEEAADGCETIYTQLRDAINTPRMDIVTRLKAMKLGKALAAFKSVSKTTTTKNEKGEPVVINETYPVPSSKDINELLEHYSPSEFGPALKTTLNVRLEDLAPMSPILSKDEWARRYARKLPKEDIQDAEIEEDDENKGD